MIISVGETGVLMSDVARVDDALRRLLSGEGVQVVLVPRSVDGGATVPPGRSDWNLALFSSGTTGPAKLVTRWMDAPASRSPAPGARWLLTYSPFRWAGVSVLVHARTTSGIVVVPERLDSKAIARAAGTEGVSHVSWTPTRFRDLLWNVGTDELRKWRLRVVTFGGEAASSRVLRDAEELWPQARIVQSLASTELGDICTTDGGEAGFPHDDFHRSGRSVDESGELFVNGQPSGDLWESVGGRYLFRGRKDRRVSVAGELVSLCAVEAAATELPGVSDARAVAVESALVGSLVTLEVRGDVDVADVRRRLRSVLPKAAVPASITIVDSLQLTDTGKVVR